MAISAVVCCGSSYHAARAAGLFFDEMAQVPLFPVVPGELRAASRILTNAGFLPPEVELRKEILTLRDLLRTVEDDGERIRKIRELNGKLLRLDILRKRPANLDSFPEYRERILDKIRG